MVGGLGVIALTFLVGWGVYEHSRSLGEWDAWTASLGRRIMFSAAVGAAPATLAHIVFRSFQLSNGVALSQSIVFGASVCSGVRVLSSAPPKLCISWSAPIAIPHSIAFLSNSYTSWEDRAMPIFLLVTLVPPVLTALSAPTPRLPVSHPRIFLPFCDMCKAHGGQHGLPRGATPVVQCHFLLRLRRRGITYPRVHVAHSCDSPGTVRCPAGASHLEVRQRHRLSSPTVHRPARGACWLLESLDASGAYEHPEYLDPRRARTILAWASMLATLGGTAVWSLVPVALHVSSEQAPAGPVTRRKFAYLASPTPMALPLPFFGCLSWHLSGSRRSQARSVDTPRVRDRRVAWSSRAHRCYARRAGLSRQAFRLIPRPLPHIYNRDCRQRKLGKSMGQR